MTWIREILIVEDEPLVAALLAERLAESGFGTTIARDSLEARELLTDVDPDGAIIDINLGLGPNGMQFGQWLHLNHPHIAMVFLTKHVDPRTNGMDSWGVPPGSCFLSKDRVSDTHSLVSVLESALRQAKHLVRHDLEVGGALSELTSAQLEILQLAASGLTNRAIAKHRGTTERSVEQRLQSVYTTLDVEMSQNVNPRVRAIAIYLQSGGQLVEISVINE